MVVPGWLDISYERGTPVGSRHGERGVRVTTGGCVCPLVVRVGGEGAKSCGVEKSAVAHQLQGIALPKSAGKARPEGSVPMLRIEVTVHPLLPACRSTLLYCLPKHPMEC